MAAGDGGSQVQFTKAEEQRDKDGWSHLDSERDLGMEFKLIERVEPEEAKRIEKEADAAGEAAK